MDHGLKKKVNTQSIMWTMEEENGGCRRKQRSMRAANWQKHGCGLALQLTGTMSRVGWTHPCLCTLLGQGQGQGQFAGNMDGCRDYVFL